VSLIDSRYQYILTEATKTLSLSRHTVDQDDDRVWFGSAHIDRKVGICHNVLESMYTAVDADGSSYTGEGFVVNDASIHPELKSRPYVLGEPHVRFYAGVPIVSRNGHKIGVYAVSDNRVRQGLSVSEFRFMHDVAEAVMDHLEMIRGSRGPKQRRTNGPRPRRVHRGKLLEWTGQGSQWI
jgi:GAF domain-containing protein